LVDRDAGSGRFCGAVRGLGLGFCFTAGILGGFGFCGVAGVLGCLRFCGAAGLLGGFGFCGVAGVLGGFRFCGAAAILGCFGLVLIVIVGHGFPPLADGPCYPRSVTALELRQWKSGALLEMWNLGARHYSYRDNCRLPDPSRAKRRSAASRKIKALHSV
jgi:hypothetical protein